MRTVRFVRSCRSIGFRNLPETLSVWTEIGLKIRGAVRGAATLRERLVAADKIGAVPVKHDDGDSTATAPPAVISLTAVAPPSLIVANDKYVNASKNGTFHQAHFAQTLARFQGGQMFTNFQTVCDVCIPHRTWPGRSFFSNDNGSHWTEIEQPFGANVLKNCIPAPANSIKCFAYPLSISDLADNTTGNLLMSEFQADGDRVVHQVSVVNATISGWPGLIPFDVKAPMSSGVAPGNWFMVSTNFLEALYPSFLSRVRQVLKKLARARS